MHPELSRALEKSNGTLENLLTPILAARKVSKLVSDLPQVQALPTEVALKVVAKAVDDKSPGLILGMQGTPRFVHGYVQQIIETVTGLVSEPPGSPAVSQSTVVSGDLMVISDDD